MAEWLNGVPVIRARVLRIEEVNICEPSSVQNITAAGGITPITPLMRVQGSGGAVTITANPQIAAGVDGQILVVEGDDDTNTVTISNGTGLHLHAGAFTIGLHDTITFIYDAGVSEWQEKSRNAPTTEKAWTFDSPAGSSGTFYFGGFYSFGGSINDFDPSINWGTADVSYAAHLMIVTGAIAADEITITVTGTSITDAGVRNATPDTETITIPNTTAANTFYETTKKWIGQIAIETTGGTAISCDYGWSKYWDNNNADFRIIGIEVTWLGGAADNTPNISLFHHRATGWTYGAGGTPTLPAAIADMNTDHNTEIKVANNQNGSWKRDNLNTTISGSSGEGTIIQVVTSANKTFELGNILLRVRPN